LGDSSQIIKLIVRTESESTLVRVIYNQCCKQVSSIGWSLIKITEHN